MSYGFSNRAMNNSLKLKSTLVLFLAGFFIAPVHASNLDTIGVTLLRTVTTNLNGTGVRVAQPEGGDGAAANWEVNPGAVSQPVGLFTYISSSGSTNNFPNSLGSESGHADAVAGNFYGMSSGVATNVTHMDNYDADYFYNSIIAATFPPNINDPVVNQSFIFCQPDFSHFPVSTEQDIDSQYDDYAAQYKTLFVSGAGNGGPTNQARIYPSATCYNGIGVAAYGGSSCIGPTLDNGRAKPDITAPAGVTSFSTPQVAGAAAVLIQAGLRGDGGSDTNSAFDIRTIKALLLNGAVKPADWTNVVPSPLDTRYGAGVLNVFNSYEQLAGGKHGFIVSTSVTSGSTHPPTGATGTESMLSGWDFNAIASTSGGIFSSATDGVNHYYFNATNGANNAAFTATITLVWNRPRQGRPKPVRCRQRQPRRVQHEPRGQRRTYFRAAPAAGPLRPAGFKKFRRCRCRQRNLRARLGILFTVTHRIEIGSRSDFDVAGLSGWFPRRGDDESAFVRLERRRPRVFRRHEPHK